MRLISQTIQIIDIASSENSFGLACLNEAMSLYKGVVYGRECINANSTIYKSHATNEDA